MRSSQRRLHRRPHRPVDRNGTFRTTIDIHEKQDVALRKICRIPTLRS